MVVYASSSGALVESLILIEASGLFVSRKDGSSRFPTRPSRRCCAAGKAQIQDGACTHICLRGKALLIRVCVAKIHHAIVTQTELNYVGSITIDQDLLAASGIRPFQYVNITNLSNGDFWQTYVIAGKAGNGDICLNGPPARHFQRGDKIIIMAEGWMEPAELDDLVPTVVFVDESNRVARVERHPAAGTTGPA